MGSGFSNAIYPHKVSLDNERLPPIQRRASQVKQNRDDFNRHGRSSWSSENRNYELPKNPSVQPYEVGTFKELNARSRTNDNINIHHIIQKQIGKSCIPGYHEDDGICIAIPKDQHRKIQAFPSNQITEIYTGKTPRRILSDDIFRNLEAQVGHTPKQKVAWLRALRKAVQLHKEKWPYVYSIQNPVMVVEKVQVLDIDLNRLIDIIWQTEEKMRIAAERLRKERRDLRRVHNGNMLHELPNDIRIFLKNSASGYSTTVSFDDKIPGEYILHQENGPEPGQQILIKARIFLDRGTKCRQGRTVMITRYYTIVVKRIIVYK